MKKIFSLLMISTWLFSCTSRKDETNLTADDRSFLQTLGVLDPKEEIELVECNGGFKGIEQSGNLITSKRIVSYWIEDGEKEIHQALFSSDIDSLSFTDLVSKPTYASYITVYKTDGTTFNVYVDADSVRTHTFFRHATENWMKYQRNYSSKMW